jgi:two-component system response regulator FlrC
MSQSSILVVEDDAPLREALCETLKLAGYQTLEADDGRTAITMLASENVDMVVSDVQMKQMDGHTLLKEIKGQWQSLPVLLMTAHGTIQKAVEAMHSGAADYLVKPFEADVLVNMVSRFISPQVSDNTDFVAAADSSKELRELASRVARSDATIMITGESGSGKEVLARHIHNSSERAAGPFIAINCAAIPENMLEATLFGYEKGAFTGAYKACAGKFEQAQAGTLLLDEISEMDLGLQAKLLRVLQEREVERLGGTGLIDLDVRVLATSNRNMHEEISAGRFREDLFYRLNVFPLHIQPLRERKQDIIPIVERLIAHHASRNGSVIPQLESAAEDKLLEHDWQGNVRELDNVMQRALILCKEGCIKADDIVFEQAFTGQATAPQNSMSVKSEENKLDTPVLENAENLGEDVKRHEHAMIIDVLRNCMGNRKIAAEKLGISPRTLRYKLARMCDAGITVPGL